MSGVEWADAHEDCKALHAWPEPYLLTFMGADGSTGYTFGRGLNPWTALDSLDFVERQVLAAICRGVVREIEARDEEAP